MCGRYVVIDSIEAIEKRFSVKMFEGFNKNFNLSIGQFAPVITNESPDIVQFFQFGLTPSWESKQKFYFNARAEGDHNLANDPNFTGAKGIISKPAFRKPIRSQRCLVIASAFIEGPKDIGLKLPYLVYLQNKQRPFAMAGIWDTWKNPENDEEVNSFSIITTSANQLLQNIGHHRMPVILRQESEKTWLKNDVELSKITNLLRQYPAELMNAYRIDPVIRDPQSVDPKLLLPMGDPIQPEPGIIPPGLDNLKSSVNRKEDHLPSGRAKFS